MRTGSCQTGLPLSVIAVMTHVFGVMPHVLMVANEKLTHSLGILLDFLQALMPILKIKSLQLESTDGILIEFLDLGSRNLRGFSGGLLVDFTDLVKFVDCGSEGVPVGGRLVLFLQKLVNF